MDADYQLTDEDFLLLDSLTDYQKECVFGEYQACMAGWRGHRWYVKQLIYSIGAAFWRAVFGRKDQIIRALLMVRVTANFSVKDGTTQAWRWRPEVISLIESWHVYVQKSTPERQKKDTDVKTVMLDRIFLESEAAKGCLKSKALLAKGHDAGPGHIIIHEHYGRPTGSTTGRQFVRGFGLQQCPSEYRERAVGGTNTVSVDVVNCNPTIMAQMSRFEAPAISALANHREDVYALFTSGFGMSRSEAKTWALAMASGASLGGPTFRDLTSNATPLTCTQDEKAQDAIDFCGQFSAEVFRLACEVCENLDIAPDGRDKFRVMTKEIQRIEDGILQSAQKYHRLRGEEVTVLIFDGYYVRGLEAVDSVDLGALSDFVYAETGYRVRFSQKPVDGKIAMAA